MEERRKIGQLFIIQYKCPVTPQHREVRRKIEAAHHIQYKFPVAPQDMEERREIERLINDLENARENAGARSLVGCLGGTSFKQVRLIHMHASRHDSVTLCQKCFCKDKNDSVHKEYNSEIYIYRDIIIN